MQFDLSQAKADLARLPRRVALPERLPPALKPAWHPLLDTLDAKDCTVQVEETAYLYIYRLTYHATHDVHFDSFRIRIGNHDIVRPLNADAILKIGDTLYVTYSISRANLQALK